MAANIQLDEGSSGKYTETVEPTAGVHRQVMVLGGMLACKLKYNNAAMVSITCTNANTNYAAGANVPAGTQYVSVYCANACRVAIGQATSSSVGVMVGAGVPAVFPLHPDDVTTGRAINAQSPTAGSVVYLTYMVD